MKTHARTRTHTHTRTPTLDGECLRLASMLEYVGQDDVLPVATIGDEAKVRERSLRRAHLLLSACQEVAEVDHEVAVPLTHVLGEDHDARQIVVLRRLLLLQTITPTISCSLLH